MSKPQAKLQTATERYFSTKKKFSDIATEMAKDLCNELLINRAALEYVRAKEASGANQKSHTHTATEIRAGKACERCAQELARKIAKEQRRIKAAKALPIKDKASCKSIAAKEKKISYAKKQRLRKTTFAIPRRGGEPASVKGHYHMEDRNHAANALSRVAQTGTPKEKVEVKRMACSKFPTLPSCKK